MSLRASNGQQRTHKRRRQARPWQQWFDRFWHQAGTDVCDMAIQWDCDPLVICHHLYHYSSVTHANPTEQLAKNLVQIRRGVEDLASKLNTCIQEAHRLEQRMQVVGLESEGQHSRRLSSNLCDALAATGKLGPPKEFSSVRWLGKNYHLVLLHEYVKFVTGTYHETALSRLAWVALVAHVDDPDGIKEITPDAVRKASKDLQRRNPRVFETIQRVAREYGRWGVIRDLIDSAWPQLLPEA
jgi:hypothetical protein